MSYVGEFRKHWRALAASSVGLGFGYTFTNYVTNVISPHLIAEFGWPKSQFALLGVVIVVAILCQPVAGRLADAFGVRRIAAVGVVSAPILFLALSRMNGSFGVFFAINVIQVVLVGGTTSVVVYTRLIARDFNLARGVALGIAASAPAVVGAIVAPVLAEFTEREGWRAAYVAVAGVVAVFGLLALAFVPENERKPGSSVAVGSVASGIGRVDYRALIRDRAFQFIIGGMLLCNLTITLQMSQISILLQDIGLAARLASLLISLYAVGVVVGRLLCGLALDKFPPHIVSAIAMASPAIGLLIIASGMTWLPAVALAIAVLGLSLGAEGDVGGYLVMRYFDRSIYSSVIGLVIAALSTSGLAGSLILSATLSVTGAYALFMTIAAVATLAGGALFLSLGAVDRRAAAMLGESQASC